MRFFSSCSVIYVSDNHKLIYFSGTAKENICLRLLTDFEVISEPEIFDDISSYTTPESVIKLGGKIWFATESGLVGFNGQKWQLYDPDVSIKWLVKTADGLLWSKNWKLGLIRDRKSVV